MSLLKSCFRLKRVLFPVKSLRGLTLTIFTAIAISLGSAPTANADAMSKEEVITIGKGILNIFGEAFESAGKVAKAVDLIEKVRLLSDDKKLCECARAVLRALLFPPVRRQFDGTDYPLHLARCYGGNLTLVGGVAQDLSNGAKAVQERLFDKLGQSGAAAFWKDISGAFGKCGKPTQSVVRDPSQPAQDDTDTEPHDPENGPGSGGTSAGTGTTSTSPGTGGPTPATSPCTKCDPIKAKIQSTRNRLDKLNQRIVALDTQIAQLDARRAAIVSELTNIEATIAGQDGVGASSIDPATGNTISSVNIGNGIVRVTTRNSAGKTISQREYVQASLAALKAKKAQLEAELKTIDARKPALQAQRTSLTRAESALIAELAKLQQQLAICIQRYCQGSASTGGSGTSFGAGSTSGSGSNGSGSTSDSDADGQFKTEAAVVDDLYEGQLERKQSHRQTVMILDTSRDGGIDLLVVDTNSDRATLFISDIYGEDFEAIELETAAAPSKAIRADLNDDGLDDLLIVSELSRNIWIHLATPESMLPYVVTDVIDLGYGPFGVSLGHLDDDAAIDMAVTNRGSGDVEVLYGTGNGRFVDQLTMTPTTLRGNVEITDLDGDGFGELVIPTGDGFEVQIPELDGAENEFEPLGQVFQLDPTKVFDKTLNTIEPITAEPTSTVPKLSPEVVFDANKTIAPSLLVPSTLKLLSPL